MMSSDDDLKKVFEHSKDVVSRDFGGELVIVPITADVGDMEDELYTMNDTGRSIWEKIDGKRSLSQVIEELESEYDAPQERIKKDVLGIVSELAKRKMLVEIEGV